MIVPKLSSEQKIFIIGELAMFATPTEVAGRFLERFGTHIERSHVAKYDPDGASSNISKELRDCFATRRQRFLEEIDDIPISHRSYRLLQLDRMFVRARDAGNRQQAASLLEQAAKETGGSLTNEVKVKHSGRVKTNPVLDPEQMKMALADAIAGALEKAQPPA